MNVDGKDILRINCQIAPPDSGAHGVPLSALQRAMVAGELARDQWQRDLVQIRCDLHEPIVPSVLQSCLALLAERHDALRARLHWNEEADAILAVDDQVVIPLSFLDLSGLTRDEQHERANALLQSTWQDPFDIAKPPRFVASLFRFEPARHQLSITYQETVLDEHAGKLLMGELLELYDCMSDGRAFRLPVPISFRDYSYWLNASRDPASCHYWNDVLSTAPAASSPPFAGAGRCDSLSKVCLGELQRELSEEQTDLLKHWAEANQTGLHAALHAAWSVVLSLHSANDDVRFASVVSLRNEGYTNGQTAVAMCFSVLPFIIRGVLARTADELLQTCRDEERATRSHSNSLDGSAEVRRQLGRPDAQSLIFFDEIDVDDFLHRSHPTWSRRRFSLLGRNPYAIAMRGFGGKRMRVQSWFNPEKYSPPEVECLLEQVIHLLIALPRTRNKNLCDSTLLPDAHLRLLADWEAGPERCYPVLPVQSLIAARTERNPSAVAVVSGGQQMTYAEVDERSNQLCQLLKSAGVGPGCTAAVCVDRSPNAIVAIVAIMKAGAAFVPVDDSWPPERIASSLRQLKTRTIISDSVTQALVDAAVAHLKTAVTIVQMDGIETIPKRASVRWFGPRDIQRCVAEHLSGPAQSADDLAYVIFTSGSAGTPKGVGVSHRAVCNLIDWAKREFDISPCDRALWVTSFGFDLSIFDLIGILACGGSIRIASNADLLSPARLVQILTNEPITFWNSAPQAFERLRRFLDLEELSFGQSIPTLRLVFLSGDWIPLALPSLIRRYFPRAKVVSLGGATEATVWSNVFVIDDVDPGWRSIPYGRPIQNARYYILDAHLNRCSIGARGELFIAGDVLAGGYEGDPDQTRERFLPDALCGTGRMYRTGDVARWRADGNIELLGRLDNQVKVRGFRIEMGEIEHALHAHAGISQAAVIARRNPSGDNQLIAYIVSQAGSALSHDDLKQHLRTTLPEYMIPATFITVNELPLSASGKIDRRRLPEMIGVTLRSNNAWIAPTTAAEISLTRIVGQVLGIKNVGTSDNFFDLGGDSLSALGVVVAAEQANLHVPIDLLRSATIKMLAFRATHVDPSIREVRPSPDLNQILLSPAQQWLVDRSFARPASYAFSTWLQCNEILDPITVSAAWQAVVDHHDALRIRFSRLNGRIVQSVCRPREKVLPKFINVSTDNTQETLARLESHAQRLSQEAEMFDSLLPQMLYAKTSSFGDLFFLFIPHMITDRYSSRIIIEDLSIACLAAKSHSAIDLPPATSSFAEWAVMLNAHAGSASLQGDCDALLGLPWHQTRALPRDFDIGANTYRHACDLRIVLTRPETESLVRLSRDLGLPAASIFVAALAQTIGEWSDSDSMLLDMTGLGRDEPIKKYPLHRSAGYFSTIYPVIVCNSKQQVSSQRIRDVDHCLQTTPGRGVLYGIMRYLHPDDAIRRRIDRLPKPEIKFNFHGMQPLCEPSWFFEPAQIPQPRTMHPDDRRLYLFNIEVMFAGETFAILWKYSAAIHRAETIDYLAKKFHLNLKRCVEVAGDDVC